MIRPQPGRGPSALVPLAYLTTATVAFVVAALGVPWLARELAGHYYHPRILALTHTITLGWITATIMGASYQLIPIVLERPVWSERLARWQLGLLVAGVVGMVGHFAIGQWPGLLWSAGLVALAVVAHIVNAALSVHGLTRWSFTARLVVAALAGLGLTTVFGLVLGADKLWHFLPGSVFANLHAHVHLALLGWVLPMVVGVAARVYPMFLLAKEPDGWLGRVQFWGLVLGVPAVVVGLVLESRALTFAAALPVAAVVAGHLAWVAAIVRRGKRPQLDWGLRFVIAGAAFLVPATLLGLALAADVVAGPRVALAYAVLALGGWLSLTIVGMMLKIVPFLAWYRAYSPHVGRAQVPTLARLSWPAAEAAAFVLLAPGMAALAVAVWLGEPAAIRATGLVVGAGALLFAATVARVLLHLAPGATRHLTPVTQARAS